MNSLSDKDIVMNIIEEETGERVLKHSSEKVTQDIYQMTQARLMSCVDQIEAIEQRLEELDREWDIERTLECNAAAVVLVGGLLGLRSKGFRLLPFVVAGFLMQHALQGWCPPVPFLRRMGVRTMKEINNERYALKALRGDFQNLAQDGDRLTRADAASKAASASG